MLTRTLMASAVMGAAAKAFESQPPPEPPACPCCGAPLSLSITQVYDQVSVKILPQKP